MYFLAKQCIYCTHNVSGQFNEENRDTAQRKRHADSDVDQIWGELRNVFG